MKKLFICIMAIVGTILAFMPEFLILGITTKAIGGCVLAVIALVLVCIGLWKFQGYCDRAVAEMREEQARRLLEERNTVIVCPTREELLLIGKHFFKLAALT